MNSKQPAYEQIRTFTAQLGGQPIQIHSKPGMPHWDSISPACQLLADAVWPARDARALLLECGHAALGAVLARRLPDGQALLLDTNVIASTMARQTLQSNAIGNARVCEQISALPEHMAAFELVILETPNNRKLARRWLVEAHGALALGGELYLAGANDQGIRSIIADAKALFGNVAVLGYKHGQRAALARKALAQAPNLVWASAPGIAPGTWHEFAIEARGQLLRLRSLPGVFAYDRLDEGTRLLIETLEPPAGARVLDLGCGSGAIGLLAARLGAAQVDLVDSNRLAVASAAENIRLNGIGGARAFASDGVPADRAGWYDAVLTNPPFHVGKAIDYDVAQAFIGQARRALKPGGRFVLVANQFIRYEQLLRQQFAQVDYLAETKSFRVWRAC